MPAERQEEEAALLAGLARGEQVQALRTERLHRDGRRIPMSITITPILDDATGQRWASVIARDITAEVAMEAEIRKLAFLDPLTQLPNRRLLLDRLQQAQQASRRHLQWAGLIYLDLDRFKALNDRHGHEVGDLYLIEVARRLRACVRESDTVARLGGDEFVLLCAELGPDEGAAREAVLAIEAKLAQAVSRAWQVGDVHHAATASLGHRLFRGADEAPGELLGDADAQMYRDKQRHPSRA